MNDRIAHRKLDPDEDICVYQEQVHTDKHGSIQGVWLAVDRGYIMNNKHESFIGVSLPPQIALNLLAWLEENRETLEQLAREQPK